MTGAETVRPRGHKVTETGRTKEEGVSRMAYAGTAEGPPTQNAIAALLARPT